MTTSTWIWTRFAAWNNHSHACRLRQEAETWAKSKFDRQIVAIAKVRGAATIYSHDAGIRTVARRIGIDVLRLQDLALPPEVAQLPLPRTLDG